MEEKSRIKEYNEGQEEDKEEKYLDKNKRFDDTEKRTDSDEIEEDCYCVRRRECQTIFTLRREVARACCSSDEAVWMTE